MYVDEETRVEINTNDCNYNIWYDVMVIMKLRWWEQCIKDVEKSINK